MKKLLSAVLTLTLILPMTVYAKTDDHIFTDPVANIYKGRVEATAQISSLRFTDMPSDVASKDAIVRSGALNIIKANAPRFGPNTAVTKEEAIAFALRAVGLEDEAQAAGVAAISTLPANSPVRDVWSIGYLSLALDKELITPVQYRNALAADQTILDPAINFIRGNAATREEFADWLARALLSANPTVFDTTATQQAIYPYRDWESIAPDKINSVENLARNRILPEASAFRPKASITRMEAATIFRNMDRLHYNTVGLVKKTGTVAGLAEEQFNETAAAEAWRMLYVRGADGKVDVLQYGISASSSPQDGPLDAVVLKDGSVTGLASLAEGDQIEYLVEPSSNTIRYVQVTGGLTSRQAQGRFRAVNITEGTLTLTDNADKAYTYPLADALYGTDGSGNGNDWLLLGYERHKLSTLPIGSLLNVTITNNVITGLSYAGEPELEPETRGIVTENNPALGYLTLIDTNGREVTKRYNAGSLRVQKTEFYDMRDTIGSIHSLFPDLRYNPRETTMESIEPGDIVSFRTDPEDGERITSISASTNYTTRYGRIRELRVDGPTASLLMEYEDGRTAWFTMANDIMILKGGRPVNVADVQSGDWAQLLINQAIIGPGHVLESVKEMAVENAGHLINAIVKGKLSGINTIQNKLNIQDAQMLSGYGWTNYKPMEQYSIAGKNIEYYYEGQPVTLSYVANYLKRSDASVYIALENNYAGDTVKKVTFRTGRDEPLPADTVLSADGNGFSILSNPAKIMTDDGTIVIRNGRLVDGRQIMAPDYATVSLNGANKAAVVDIGAAPDTSGVMIARGRIYSVDQGKSFKVQSMSLFGGQEWNYTPIQREFTIDNSTLFMNGSGLTSINDFIDYTAASVYDQVFNIVIDGSHAARVIDAPYSAKAIRGTIYSVDGETVSLRNVYTYDDKTGKWSLISNRNATSTVTVPVNAIVADRNRVIGVNNLTVGSQVKVMTDTLPATIGSGMSVTGYIVLVER